MQKFQFLPFFQRKQNSKISIDVRLSYQTYSIDGGYILTVVFFFPIAEASGGGLRLSTCPFISLLANVSVFDSLSKKSVVVFFGGLFGLIGFTYLLPVFISFDATVSVFDIRSKKSLDYRD